MDLKIIWPNSWRCRNLLYLRIPMDQPGKSRLLSEAGSKRGCMLERMWCDVQMYQAVMHIKVKVGLVREILLELLHYLTLNKMAC